MLKHLNHNISHLIKLSFNTLKSTRVLDALSSSGNPHVKSKSPLPSMPNIELIYDTSPRTTTRAARRGSLIGGTKALDAQAG
jgi:hypothetical protein